MKNIFFAVILSISLLKASADIYNWEAPFVDITCEGIASYKEGFVEFSRIYMEIYPHKNEGGKWTKLYNYYNGARPPKQWDKSDLVKIQGSQNEGWVWEGLLSLAKAANVNEENAEKNALRREDVQAALAKTTNAAARADIIAKGKASVLEVAKCAQEALAEIAPSAFKNDWKKYISVIKDANAEINYGPVYAKTVSHINELSAKSIPGVNTNNKRWTKDDLVSLATNKVSVLVFEELASIARASSAQNNGEYTQDANHALNALDILKPSGMTIEEYAAMIKIVYEETRSRRLTIRP